MNPVIRANYDKAYCSLYKHPYMDVRVSGTENMALPATALGFTTQHTLHNTTQAMFRASHVDTFMFDFFLCRH